MTPGVQILQRGVSPSPESETYGSELLHLPAITVRVKTEVLAHEVDHLLQGGLLDPHLLAATPARGGSARRIEHSAQPRDPGLDNASNSISNIAPAAPERSLPLEQTERFGEDPDPQRLADELVRLESRRAAARRPLLVERGRSTFT